MVDVLTGTDGPDRIFALSITVPVDISGLGGGDTLLGSDRGDTQDGGEGDGSAPSIAPSAP